MGDLRLTRRRGLMLLAALAPVSALTACGEDEPSVTASVPVEPDTPDLNATVAEQEAALIALYDSVLDSLPESDARRREILGELRQQHVDHHQALVPGQELASTPPSPDGAPVAPGVRDLAAAERSAAKERIAACIDASDPDLARTLAFIAASEASHVPALSDLL